MAESLEVFKYKDSQVRTVIANGEVWLVAKDVCDVLELDNPTKALMPLDDDEKMTLRISEGNRGNQNEKVINEPGLYALILRSKTPQAKMFSRFVCHEVLLTLSRTLHDKKGEEVDAKTHGVQILQSVLEAY